MKNITEKERKEDEQRWGDGDCLKDLKSHSALPEEYYHGLDDPPWNLNSLEQSLYISLRAWIQRALFFNLLEQFGIWTFQNILPRHLKSYILLLYTLLTAAIISFIYRVKHIFYHALSILRDLKQDMTVHLQFACTRLRRLLPNRFQLLQSTLALFLTPWSCLQPLLSLALCYLSSCVATSTTIKNNTEHESPHLWSRQRSVLCLQLSSLGDKSPNDIGDATAPSLILSLQLSLELEMDSCSDMLQIQKDKLDFERRLLLDSEKQMNIERDENLSFPCISYMDVQEED